MSGSAKKEFKIKVLPKKDAKKEASSASPSSAARAKSSTKKRVSKAESQSAYGFLVICVVAVGIVGLILSSQSPTDQGARGPQANGESENPKHKNLNRYLQDGQKRKEMDQLGVQVENSKATRDDLPAFLPLDSEDGARRPMGVELEQDPSMENVYKDLYGESRGAAIQSPEERISSRLAEKKWIHHFEKQEKKVFIQNFIASAKDAGYEIELNDDLIVTKVKPITNRPKISLEKVIENMNNR